MLKIKSEIYARVAVQDIDMLTKIIEAYDHLGIVSTINRQEGLVIVRGTADTRLDLLQILTSLPFPLEIIEEQ
ncbi:MAG: DUF4911 domain-containing protein [Syntrophomonadaceae bacterium]|nr:DUF4911 domain-containing protein [Syntrophomonadaceae bacterium]